MSAKGAQTETAGQQTSPRAEPKRINVAVSPDTVRALENVIITSHLAGQTVEARARAGLAAAQAVIDVLAGREPAHPVDR